MRTILFIVQKEFIQIFRDKFMPKIIFGIPLFQLLILSFAATFEIKHTRMAILDQSHSQESRHLISKFEASSFYELTDYVSSFNEAEALLLQSKVQQVLVIPASFTADLEVQKKAYLQVLTDAVDGSAAAVRMGYAQSIVAAYNNKLVTSFLGIDKLPLPIQTTYSYWYNPELNYQTYMVPGILALLVTILGMFLSGMNLVKEKEIGTIEQINVTPIRPYQFIIGKLLPFWIIAMVIMTFGMVLAKLIFNVPFLGSIGLIYLLTAVYLLVVLALGMIISTFTDTQQQAMFIAWFFLVIFILLSGLFTPTDSMPHWAQEFNRINPVAYYIKALRMVMLKGSGLADIKDLFIAIGVYALVANAVAIFRYKKTA
jgi:ABC-2 type transport system permease protein